MNATALLLTAALIGQTPSPEMQEIRKDVEAFRRLEQRGYIPPETIAPLEKRAQEIIGKKVTVDEFMQLSETPPSMWDKLVGFVTFANILWVTAGIFMTIAICWLFGIYILELVLAIPPPILEFLMYAGVAAGIILPKFFMGEDWQMLVAFPACLALYGVLAYSITRRELELTSSVSFLTIAVAWAAAAIFYGSQVLGFISVLALMVYLGFSAFMIPGCIGIGFEKDAYIPRTMFAALTMLVVYLVMEIGNFAFPHYQTFKASFVFIGCFIYFLGLLIVANKWYCYQNDSAYIATTLLAILSGIAAIYLGSVFQLPTLLGVAGTFFYIWLLERYYEIPWKSAGWAWSMLGLAGILYGFYIFAKTYPQLFLWR